MFCLYCCIHCFVLLIFISGTYLPCFNPCTLAGTNVGTHDAPIRCVEYCPDVNVIITGSWDSSVKLWDPRTPCSAGTFPQPDKVCSLQVFLSFLGMIDTTDEMELNF